jgi:hypothetical protein
MEAHNYNLRIQLRQKDHEVKANLGYIARPCLFFFFFLTQGFTFAGQTLLLLEQPHQPKTISQKQKR